MGGRLPTRVAVAEVVVPVEGLAAEENPARGLVVASVFDPNASVGEGKIGSVRWRERFLPHSREMLMPRRTRRDCEAMRVKSPLACARRSRCGSLGGNHCGPAEN